MEQLRSVAAYPDLVGMPQVEFEQGATRASRADCSRQRWAGTPREDKATVPPHHRIGYSGPRSWTDDHVRDTSRGGLVLTNGATLYAFEAKHYFTTEVTKDLLAVFNQKTLDFYLELLRRGLPVSMKHVFVARTSHYNFKVREFAWSWGLALLGGEQRHPLWLHHQLVRWLDTRECGQGLIEHVGLADELARQAMRDLADLVAPFSAKQATLRLDQLLGSRALRATRPAARPAR